jgi:hypothetical protein
MNTMNTMPTRWIRSSIMVGSLGLAMVCPLRAQVVRGVIRDSTSQLAIAGAVISTVDSAGRIGLRVLSNERGSYRIPSTTRVARLQVVRIGFRPVEVRVPAGGGDVELDILMKRIPYGLQPVHVTGGEKCPRRSDRGAALALFEQARDGLLATVVARSERPARMKRLTIDRVHDGDSERLKRHKVIVDSATSIASYVAAHSAVDFVRDGFATDSSEGATYYAPDADVLLDDGFANGYCFHLMDRVRARPNQIGLGFRSADRKRGRVDVDGAIWIDTVARALMDIEFRYVGLPGDVTRLGAGGRVAFREMPNGVVLIDRWMLRLVGSETDSTLLVPNVPAGTPSYQARLRPSARTVVVESGGELARVAWPGGTAWRSDLGRLSLAVMDLEGKPLRSNGVRLEDTNYEATTDSAGHLEIDDLAPGPYFGQLVDPRVESIKLTIPMALNFVATRGATTTRSVRTGTLEDFIGGRCREDKAAIVGKRPRLGVAWIVGRIVDRSGAPLQGLVAGVPFSFRMTMNEPIGSLDKFESFSKVDSNGIFVFCGVKRDATVEITFKRGTQVVGSISHIASEAVNVVPVVLDLDSRRQ